jgi:hypothetical protein
MHQFHKKNGDDAYRKEGKKDDALLSLETTYSNILVRHSHACCARAP